MNAPKRLRRALFAGLGLLLVMTIVLLQPGGRVQADVTEHVVFSGWIPDLQPGDVVEQPLHIRRDGLSEVAIRVGTYAAVAGCGLSVDLVDDHDSVVAHQRWACSQIPDASLLPLRFPPMRGTADHTYRLRIAADATGDRAVTLAAGAAVGDVVDVIRDGSSTEQALEVHTGYRDDSTAASQVSLLLRRIQQYGPLWARPAAVVGLVVLAMASLVAVAAVGDRRRLAVLLIVIFALTKGLLWSVAIPAFEGVDEAAHFSYAQFMAEDHHVPKRGTNLDGRGTTSTELLVALDVVHREAAPPGDRPDFGPGPDGPDTRLDAPLDRHAGGNGYSAGYSPAYYGVPALLEIGDASIIDRLHRMRLWSVVLGALTAWGAYLVGTRVFRRHPFAPSVLAVAVAAHPMLSQQTAIVNNDALLIATGPFCLLAAIDLTRPERSRWLPLLAGVAAGVATVAKPLGAAWVPVLGLAWLIGRRRGATEVSWWRDVGWAGIGLAVTYGPWVVASTLLGYPGVGLSGEPKTAARGALDFVHRVTEHGFLELRRNWIDQFWGNFAWINTPFPEWIWKVILVAVVAGAIVVAAAVVKVVTTRRRARSTEVAAPLDADDVAVGAVGLMALAVMGVGLLWLMWQYFHRVGAFDFIQGRYALMLVPVVFIVPVLAIKQLTTRVSPTAALTVIASAMVTLNVVGIDLVVGRFYL